jgi:hypothetical protein
MVTKLGMSDDLGTIYLGKDQEVEEGKNRQQVRYFNHFQFFGGGLVRHLDLLGMI